jgi:catechol 2,3-dioxygenase-like lactoylglutathione lyase family enzyme
MTAPRPYRLGRAAPTVPTRDLEAALGFHVGVLGMTETIHAHVQAQGVRVVKGIRDADHGMRTFVMCDPDGNRIDVGEASDQGVWRGLVISTAPGVPGAAPRRR